jgi:cobalt/nickel transport system permease protein
VFNMGLIGTFGGYYLYRMLRQMLGFNAWKGTAIALAVSAWVSVVVAAVICAFQLALSGTVPLPVALTAMLTWHVLIGIGEAMITVLAMGYVWRVRPDLLYDRPRRKAERPLIHS